MRQLYVPAQSEREALEAAIKLLGGQTKTAKHFGLIQSSVRGWLEKGCAPAERVLQLERLTDFKVKRHELRPDIYPPDEYSIVSIILQMSNGLRKKALKVLKALLKKTNNTTKRKKTCV